MLTLLLRWRCQNIWCIIVCCKWGCIASDQAGFPHTDPSLTLQQWGSRASYQNYWIIDEGVLSWWIINVIMYGKEARQQQNVEQCSAWNLVSGCTCGCDFNTYHLPTHCFIPFTFFWKPVFPLWLWPLFTSSRFVEKKKPNLQDLKKLMLML